MANKVFEVQSVNANGPDRVSVNFTEVVPGGMSMSAFNLSLTNEEAATYTVHGQFTLSLTAVTQPAPSSTSSTSSTTP